MNNDRESSMSKGGKPAIDVFDIARIRQIVELMEEHELSEIDLQQGDDRIKLARGTTAPMVTPAPVPAPAVSSPAGSTPAADPGSQEAGNTITINSPMVGTFYARPNPESEAFVNVGSSVSEDTVVCIVEAMKVFNEIPAECRGKVVEILAEDHQPVDFGMPLFRVEPNA